MEAIWLIGGGRMEMHKDRRDKEDGQSERRDGAGRREEEFGQDN